MLTRALVAFIALPGLVAFVVPLLLAWRTLNDRSFSAIALVPLVAGLALLLWCVRDFHVVGKGTLAPWQPPLRLVSSGPYRVSRNPMYIAVSLILVGWAIAFRSWGLLAYAMACMAAFRFRVVLAEEPWLARAYGAEWKRYAARVPRWIFPNRTVLSVACLGLAVALPVAGLIYETVADARDAREFPPPGSLVDIGGRRLHLLCIGDGAPTVIFEASGWGTSVSSSSARERVAARTTVCSYDRRGRGWSDAAPGVTTVSALANDLGVLQDRARLQWPFVIVASSIGGATAEMFTRRHPERVAGLVLVDAASSLSLASLASRRGTITAAACAASALAQFGLMRLLDPFEIGGDSDGARRDAAMTYGARSWAEMCAMARGLAGSQREFEEAAPFPRDVPLTVLSASSAADLVPPGIDRFVSPTTLRTELEGTHRQLSRWSDHGSWKQIPDSTHLIANSQPDAVADAVLDLLDLLRP